LTSLFTTRVVMYMVVWPYGLRSSVALGYYSYSWVLRY